MNITQEYLEEAFGRYNTLIFAGRLPQPELRTVTAKTFMGNCRSRIERRADGRVEHHDFVLQVSRSFELTPAEVDDVIVHEMIHLFIMVHSLPDTSPHGEIFRAMMHNINRAYGLSMSVSERVAPDKRKPEPKKWRVVARVSLADGKAAFKVLPRVRETIMKYRNGVMRSGQVAGVKLYMTTNELFGRYPSSGALKVYPMDAKILDEALRDAEPLQL